MPVAVVGQFGFQAEPVDVDGQLLVRCVARHGCVETTIALEPTWLREQCLMDACWPACAMH
eukprot:11179016-Lingulodinium_polyedra.AAC.1